MSHHHHHHQDEYQERGYDQGGYEQGGYERGGHEQRGYEERGFEQGGYEQRGYQQGPPAGYQQGGQGGPPGGYQQGGMGGGYQQHQQSSQMRKKSLLIGINYVGSKHTLQGCHGDVDNVQQFLTSVGYPTDQRSQVVMRDDRQTDPRGPFFPNGRNILAAMQWLISEPGTCNFLHYSGHGGQVRDPDGDRGSGFDDTIVPQDFEQSGQIDSDTLHKLLISRLPPNSSLFVVFDCCHSGSAIELPYVYRTDEDGNVSLMDNVKQGAQLLSAANNLIQGGFSMTKVNDAKQLLAGASSFFKSFQHRNDPVDESGLGEEHFAEDWKSEHKNVWMYSGCRDDQTSADAAIAGEHVGAMSWAFLESMKKFGPRQSYIQVLQNTRGLLKGRYQQVPQLSVGYQQDLNQPIRI